MIHTKDQIDYAIKQVPTHSEEELIHLYKCASSKKHIAYKGYMEALYKELKKRHKELGIVEHAEES